MLSVEHLGTRDKQTVPQGSNICWFQSNRARSNFQQSGCPNFQFLCPNFDAVKFTRTGVAHRAISF